MKRNRIHVVITADTVGGVWDYVAGILVHMAPHVSFSLLTMGEKLTEDRRSFLANLDHVKYRETTLKLEWMSGSESDLEIAGDILKQMVRESKADLVHLNSYAFGAIDFGVPAIVVAHSCVFSWWLAVKGEEPPADYDDYYSRVQKGIKKATHIVSPSKSMLSELETIYGVVSSASVIKNGVDLALFEQGEKKPFVFSAGRVWDDAKNFRSLRKAANHISWPFLIAGNRRKPDGEMVNIDNVHLLGTFSKEEIKLAYAKASVYAHPALYEPFGLSVLEAAASGCALVLSDIPSLRENWNEAAVFVDPMSQEEIRAVISKLIATPGEIQKMAKLAKEKAATMSTQKTSQQYLKLYHTLCGKIQQHEKNIYENKVLLSQPGL